jgi:hypothetical protein
MKLILKKPPREFEVGFDKKGVIKDCASLLLSSDEQVTFKTEAGAEYDVTRKSWGFYATPSTNGRLSSFGLRAVLVKNRIERYFVLLVERGREKEFEEYIEHEPLGIVAWLDDLAHLEELSKLKLAVSRDL